MKIFPKVLQNYYAYSGWGHPGSINSLKTETGAGVPSRRKNFARGLSINIFYDVRGLPYKQQELLLRKAYSVCERWWFDKLDCSVSYTRQVIEGISFEKAMSHFREGVLTTVIHRRQVIPLDEQYLEVGFRSMESPGDYFLWIIVPLDKADQIVNGLKVMK